MKDFEIKQLQDYLNKKFETTHFNLKTRKSIDDSCEVYLDNEFLGLIYFEKDDGETAYQFHMTILSEDLLDS